MAVEWSAVAAWCAVAVSLGSQIVIGWRASATKQREVGARQNAFDELKKAVTNELQAIKDKISSWEEKAEKTIFARAKIETEVEQVKGRVAELEETRKVFLQFQGSNTAEHEANRRELTEIKDQIQILTGRMDHAIAMIRNRAVSDAGEGMVELVEGRRRATRRP